MAQGSPSGSGSPADAASPASEPPATESAAEASTSSGVPDGSLSDVVRERLGRAGLLDGLSDDDGDVRVTRREALAYAGGAGAGLGGWKALHNVVLGYGVLAGTNLTEQDLPALASERFGVRSAAMAVGGYEIRTDGDSVGLYDGDERLDGVAIGETSGGAVADATTAASGSTAAAERIDAEYGLAEEPVSQLAADVGALAAGEATFAFAQTDEFLDRIAAADPRPYTVDALRGPVYESPDSEFVADFADVHPADAGGLIGGLTDGFREYSSYDVPRYAAGSVEDNILLGAVDLRQYFESPADFEALAAGDNTGLFCTELVDRSVEAFHAVPATEQSPPIAAGTVYDRRHKHSYTALASAIRESGDLVVPVTFVDYTHSTLYDDLHLTWLLGEGVEAYNDRHRATEIFWNSYASV